MCDDLEVDEEDFQTVPLDDNHWTTEEIPHRHLYTQTFSTSFTVSIPMSIYGLYFYIVQ